VSDSIIILLGLLTLGVLLGLLVLLFVAAKVIAAVRIIKGDAEKREISPQPFEVQMAAVYADKEELKSFGAQLVEIRKDSEERARRLHARIDPVVENTAEIKGRMEAFTQSFDNFTRIMETQRKEAQ
jgi:hypothetical protein